MQQERAIQQYVEQIHSQKTVHTQQECAVQQSVKQMPQDLKDARAHTVSNRTLMTPRGVLMPQVARARSALRNGPLSLTFCWARLARSGGESMWIPKWNCSGAWGGQLMQSVSSGWVNL